MTAKKNIIPVLLSAVALAVALAALILALSPAKQPEESADIHDVLDLGTNDKDTNQPVFTPEEAKAQAEKILLDHFGGYTIQEANGGWIDGETVFTEYTLVIYLSDTDMKHVHAAADEMISTFRQRSVLIQANRTETEFYAGNN